MSATSGQIMGNEKISGCMYVKNTIAPKRQWFFLPTGSHGEGIMRMSGRASQQGDKEDAPK